MSIQAYIVEEAEKSNEEILRMLLLQLVSILLVKIKR